MFSVNQKLPTVLVLLWLVLSPLSGAWAAEEASPPEGVDPLALAALMIKDGHFDRAEAVLFEVDENEKGVDKGRLYALRGLLFLRRGLFVEAREQLRKSSDSGFTDGSVHLYLAQAHYGVGEYARSLDALSNAGEAAAGAEGAYLLKAQCFWKLERREEAWAALGEGESRFTGDVQFERQRIFYLIDAGLYQEAGRRGRAYLASTDADAQEYVAIGEGLRQSRRYDEATLILEQARLRHPKNADVLAALARTYLDRDRLLSAARLFEQAAATDARKAAEAAELYRRKGRLEQALYLNAQLPDQPEKIRQRLGILVQAEQFEACSSLEPRLARLGLLNDDEIRYALAYCHYRSGDSARAEIVLKSIRRADLFQKANELRKAMQNCAEAGWQCY